MSRQHQQKHIKDIALERIETLFSLAEAMPESKNKYVLRYVRLGRKIAMRYRISLPREIKRKFCKGCGELLIPGRNLKIRLYNKTVIRKCLGCGNIMRIPYVKEKKTRKKFAEIKPTVIIGKDALTESVIEEINAQLKTKTLIKLKFLRSALHKEDRLELIREIEMKTNGKVRDIRGNTVMLEGEKNDNCI